MSNQISTVVNPAALQSDGAYVSEQIVSQALPPGPNSNVLVILGLCNWGLFGTPQAFADTDTGAPLYGDTSVSPNSSGVDYGMMARVYLAGAAPANQIVGVRAPTDGTDTAATAYIADDNPATSGHYIALVTGKCTGTYGNKISYQLDLISGTTTAKPMYRFTVYPPTGNPEVFIFKGYSSTAYSQAVFAANFVAMVNGTNGTPASNWVVASTVGSPSSTAPFTGLQIALLGGSDGASGVTDTTIFGTNALGMARTGLYVLNGLVGAATVCVAGISSYASFATLAGWVQQQICRGVWGFPANTDTPDAISDREANTLSSAFVMLLEDAVEFQDPVTGALRWLEASAIGGAVMAATPTYKYVGNKPYSGLVPGVVLATERTIGGATPIDIPNESGERESNGINWIGNPIPRGNVFGLFHGMMSDGVTKSQDVGMANVIALEIKQILNQFVGEMQTTDNSDDTRFTARGKVNEYMNSLTTPTRQIDMYEDTLDSTDNTPDSIDAGIMMCKLEVETLNAIRFAIAAIYVGSGIQISVNPLQ